MKNIIKRDLKAIWSKSKKFLLLHLLIILMLQIMIFMGGINPLEVFLEFTRDQGYITSLSGFFPPVAWLLLQLIPTSVFSMALYNDHVENASYMVLKSESKYKYFVSKLIVCFLLTFAINFLLYVLLSINLFFYKEFSIENIRIMNRIIGSYFISQFLLIVIAYLVSIKIGYKFALSINLIFLIISMTSNSKWVLGQQTLAFKQDILGGYITLKDSIIVWLAYTFILLVCGYFIFKTYNFYGKENRR